MYNKKRGIKILGGGLLFLIITILSMTVCRLSGHEANQNDRIENLERQIEKFNAEKKADSFDVSFFSDDGYNYLAIGNSITVHGICDYWWNEIGMAASAEEKDYVHQTEEMLQKQFDQKCNVFPFNYYIWEIQALDREETYYVLDEYLSPEIDLVTIQLGENITDITTLEKDFEELIRHIQDKCPKAEIIMIGQFWRDNEKDIAKMQASEVCDIVFLDLKDIQNKVEYQAGLGMKTYDKEGNPHFIEHEGVAKHPNDLAMEWIAKNIVESVIGEKNCS